MKYFHTQKLSWSTAYAYNNLPNFARWQGTDGSEILGALRMNHYSQNDVFRKDMSKDSDMAAKIAENLSEFGIPATVKYVGPSGDRGGGLDKETADWLSKSIDSDGPVGVAMNSSSGVLDQLFHMGYDKLPVIDHGLPMRTHGVGSYTSQTMLKYWNRKGELLGNNAERASVAANWLGALPYQQSTLNEAWVRLLWHQFHDDLPGTCIPEAYQFTVNDQVLNQLDFSRTLNNSVGAVAKHLDTQQCTDIPMVVYNPLSIDRKDIVEGTIAGSSSIRSIIVTDANGQRVPSQVVAYENGQVRFIFLADVPSLGYATYNVAPSTEAQSSNASLSVSNNGMENQRYKVVLDNNGDVSSIIDKSQGNKEMLSAPIRLAMLFDESLSSPSWEIHGDQLQKEPREYVDKEGLDVQVVENGPLRASIRIKRTKAGSTFCQYIRLAAEGASDRIDFVNEVDWQTHQRLLKATFPLTASNSKANYDLSLGADVNNNSTNYSTDIYNTDALCEFLGHQWADVTHQDNSFGISILNDCKYGWDKQKDNEIRLTLIHTPKVGSSYIYQAEQDLGLNKFTYSFFAHKGGWGADTQWEADKLNNPMMAYQTTRHDGTLGHRFCMASVNNRNVAVKALKKAEVSDKTIIRFYELTNSGQDVEVTFPASIESAEEVNGVEDYIGSASYAGNKLTFHIDRFHPKTFALTLSSPSMVTPAEEAPTSTSVSLDFDTDVISYNANRADADIEKSYPAELVSEEIVADGIIFRTGDKADGAKNAMRCKGQTINLPATANGKKVYLLASSLNENGNSASFQIGSNVTDLNIGYYAGMMGVFSNELDVKKTYRQENTAFTATHLHKKSNKGDGIYEYLYMYKYVLDLPDHETTLQLPDNPEVLVYAITVSDNDNDDTTPVSQIVQLLEHTDTPDTYDRIQHEDPALTPASIKASGQTNNAEAPIYAADDDLNTKWCDDKSDMKWIEYRFDKPMTISAWRVTNAYREGINRVASEYYLQRITHQGWVDVDGIEKNTINTTDRTLEQPIVTEGVRLRYAHAEQDLEKLMVARLYDFKVFGHEATDEEIDNTSMVISRIPTYGYGKPVARIHSYSACTNVAEDPYYVLDSESKTKWCDNSSSSPFITLELSDVYTLDRFDIYDARTYEDTDNSNSYSIAVSTDGKTFKTVASKSGVASESLHTCILEQPADAKYVRLQISKGGGNAARVYRFDVWGVQKEPSFADGSVPISIQKTILGSSSIQDNSKTALNLIDGEKGKISFAWDFPKPSSGYGWFVLDLEAIYDVSKFILYDAGSVTGNTSDNVSSYRIFTSLTAPTETALSRYSLSSLRTGWTLIENASGKGSENVKTTTLASPVRARYVMVDIPRSYMGETVRPVEFEVYGSFVMTGIEEVGSGAGADIHVWPGNLQRGEDIHVTVSDNHAHYALYTTSGSLVRSGTFCQETSISTSSMKPGLYLLKVNAGDQSVGTKIIVR